MTLLLGKIGSSRMLHPLTPPIIMDLNPICGKLLAMNCKTLKFEFMKIELKCFNYDFFCVLMKHRRNNIFH